MQATTSTYTGPAYWTVNAVDDFKWDVVDMHGTRVATYPNFRLADKVRKDLEAKAMRAYTQAQRKAAKK
jgi:hypothetical protein